MPEYNEKPCKFILLNVKVNEKNELEGFQKILKKNAAKVVEETFIPSSVEKD